MAKHDKNGPLPPEGSSMEQVRDLLFGTQFKELELRLQRVAERFERDIADSGNALRNRIDSLENFMKSESSSFLNRLNAEKTERDSALKDCKRAFDEAVKSESRERQEALKNEQHERADALRNEQRERAEGLAHLAKELASAVEAWERRLSSLSGTLDATERELRQLMLAENNSLSCKIDDRYLQAQELLKRTAEQIRHDMVYRGSLSGMLTEVAVKLSGQWSSDSADHPSPANGASFLNEAPQDDEQQQG